MVVIVDKIIYVKLWFHCCIWLLSICNCSCAMQDWKKDLISQQNIRVWSQAIIGKAFCSYSARVSLRLSIYTCVCRPIYGEHCFVVVNVMNSSNRIATTLFMCFKYWRKPRICTPSKYSSICTVLNQPWLQVVSI